MTSLLVAGHPHRCLVVSDVFKMIWSCIRHSLDVAEEVRVNDEVFPGGDRDDDASQKTNNNIEAFHTRIRRHDE